jgi:hypothetical protein
MALLNKLVLMTLIVLFSVVDFELCSMKHNAQ